MKENHNNTHGFTLFKLIFSMSALLIVVVGITGICSYFNNSMGNGESANHRVLREQGYKNIKLGGIPMFKCGESDDMILSDKFTATSPNGYAVSGAVCTAFFKGRTIRLD
jgi:hypothetical protein